MGQGPRDMTGDGNSMLIFTGPLAVKTVSPLTPETKTKVVILSTQSLILNSIPGNQRKVDKYFIKYASVQYHGDKNDPDTFIK